MWRPSPATGSSNAYPAAPATLQSRRSIEPCKGGSGEPTAAREYSEGCQSDHFQNKRRRFRHRGKGNLHLVSALGNIWESSKGILEELTVHASAAGVGGPGPSRRRGTCVNGEFFQNSFGTF